jgi:hypothetical protein
VHTSDRDDGKEGQAQVTIDQTAHEMKPLEKSVEMVHSNSVGL